MKQYEFDEAIEFLSSLELWGPYIEAIGACTHKTMPNREPYEALIRAVAYQQISTKAGNNILHKFVKNVSGDECRFPTPLQIIEADHEVIRHCGFSNKKVDTIKQIASGVFSGVVPNYSQMITMSDEEIINQLVGIKGIGKWTVEMLLIYSFERMDIMPIDDYGIKEGLIFLYSQGKKLNKKELKSISENLSPYRTVASWYLWRIIQTQQFKKYKETKDKLSKEEEI